MPQDFDIHEWRLYQANLNLLNEEEEDDWNITTDAFDVIELTVGDTITPDMWIDGIFDYISRKWNLKSHKILNIHEWVDIDRVVVQLEGLGDDNDYVALGWLNKRLKPQYRVVPPLNESEDDDWNITTDAFDVVELGVGDKITPDMWNMDHSWTKWLFNLLKNVSPERDSWKIDRFEDKDEEGEEANIVYIINTNTGDNFYEDVDNLNKYLKPKYQILSPDNPKPKSKNIFKRIFNKLKEQEEDDFNITLGDEWGVKELTVGDEITPDMWSESYITSTKSDRVKNHIVLYPQIIRDIWGYDGITYFLINGEDGYIFRNSDLKPQYKVVKPINESDDDDFNITLGDNWNITELTVGDTITPDMWIDGIFDQSIREWNLKNLKIIDVKEWYGKLTVWIEIFKGGYERMTLNWLNNQLKPQYKVVLPESLFESDDDFNITLGDNWNVEELTVGDIIEPEMWGYDYGDGMKYFQKVPVEIREFGEDWEGKYVTLYKWEKGQDFGDYLSVDLDEIHDYLKPQYKVVPPLNESEDDDFNITLGDEWNVKELEAGDEITPDMWDFEKIKDWIVRRSEGDHAQVADELKQIQNLKTDNIKIKNIKKEQMGGWNVVWVELDHPLLDSFSDARLNTFLKPDKVKIIPPINESEDDDWTITTDAFDEKYLKVGDYFNEYSSDKNVSDKDDFGFWSGLTYQIVFIGEKKDVPEKYHKESSYDDNDKIVVIQRTRDGDIYHFGVKYFNKEWGNKLGATIPEHLYEQEDDDFNITTDAFDERELGVGDIITNDMLKINTGINLPAEILQIQRFGGNDFVTIKYKREGKEFKDTDLINNWEEHYLDNRYTISRPNIKESEDDDFNITLDDKWNEYDGGVEIIIKGPWRYNLFTYLEDNDNGFIEDFIKLNPHIDFDDEDMFIEYRTYKIKTNTHQLKKEFGEWDDIPEGNIFTDVSIDGLVEWLGGDYEFVVHFLYSSVLHNDDFDKEVIDSKVAYWDSINDEYYFNIKWPNKYKPNDIIDERFDEDDDLMDEIELISVRPSNINESEDDDFNITLGNEWNTKSITIGDYLDYNNSKIGNKSSALKIVEYNPERNTIGTLKGIINDEGEFETTQTRPFRSPVRSVEKFLKPGYELVLPNRLSENEDDDWNITTDAFAEYDGPLTVTLKGPGSWELIEYIDGDFLEELNKLNPNLRYGEEDIIQSYLTLEFKTSTDEIKSLLDNDIDRILKSSTKEAFENWLSEKEILWLWFEMDHRTNPNVRKIKEEVMFYNTTTGNLQTLKWPEEYEIDNYLVEWPEDLNPGDVILVDVK